MKRMMNLETIIKGLEIERKCASSDCDRDCGKCDLVQDKEWLLSVYDGALELLKEWERKKGSWDYGTQCSACKGTIIPPKDRKVRVNFCPWRGADMRGLCEQKGR